MYNKEIKEAVEKYAKCPLLGMNSLNIMAKSSIKGELDFWKNIRYEYLEKIKDNSIIGIAWINSGCPDLVEIINVSEVISNLLIAHYSNEKYYGHLDPKQKDEYAIKEINDFFWRYLEYRAIDAVIMELESSKKETKKTTKSISTFKDIFVSEKAYNEALKWLEENKYVSKDKFLLDNGRDIAMLFLTLRRFGYAIKLNTREGEAVSNDMGLKYARSSFSLFKKMDYTVDDLKDKRKNTFYNMPLFEV